MIEGISYYKRPKKNNKKLVIIMLLIISGIGFGVYYFANTTVIQHNEIIITPQQPIIQNTNNTDILESTTNQLPAQDTKHLHNPNANTMLLEPLDKAMEDYK
jgi:uncharacterized protein HemX